jgi:hypothetical protein
MVATSVTFSLRFCQSSNLVIFTALFLPKDHAVSARAETHQQTGFIFLGLQTTAPQHQFKESPLM